MILKAKRAFKLQNLAAATSLKLFKMRRSDHSDHMIEFACNPWKTIVFRSCCTVGKRFDINLPLLDSAYFFCGHKTVKTNDFGSCYTGGKRFAWSVYQSALAWQHSNFTIIIVSNCPCSAAPYLGGGIPTKSVKFTRKHSELGVILTGFGS